MNTIIIANQKGGSAKTTTTIHLGHGLALAGCRVLLVDMDPQGHLAEGLGLSALNFEREISLVLDNKAKIEEIIVNARPNLDLAPTNIRLSYLEALLFTRHRREDRLRNAIAQVKANYDYVLIDCPPSLGILTVNGLAAADYVLIPMVVEYYSMLGVGLLLQTIQEMRAEINPELKLMGLLPTRHNRTLNAKEVLERTTAEVKDIIQVYKTPIPETVRFREAAALGQTIFEYEPNNPGALAYTQLAKEVLNHDATKINAR
jgi:chromosome partitioning protein